MSPQSVSYWVTLGLAVQGIFHAAASYNTSIFELAQPEFNYLLGSTPQLIELATDANPLFHEGAVYHAPTKAWWMASGTFQGADNKTEKAIVRVTGTESSASVKVEQIPHTMPAPTSAHRYIAGTSFGDVLIWVCFGIDANTPPAGLYAMSPYPPYNSSLLLGSYGGYPFNSPDDLTVTPDGVVWFTDPVLGYVLTLPYRNDQC